MTAFNSRLCQITWTDAVRGSEHFVFASEGPLELRFGLQFEPSFWSSFDFSEYFLNLEIYRNGSLLTNFQESGGTRDLPGAPSNKQWLGLSFGKAEQVAGTGVAGFRPAIFFERSSSGHNIAGEFAVASAIHFFLIDPFAPFAGDSFTSQHLVGGHGQPA